MILVYDSMYEHMMRHYAPVVLENATTIHIPAILDNADDAWFVFIASLELAKAAFFLYPELRTTGIEGLTYDF